MEFSTGKWQQPLRGVLAQHGGFFGVMPASGESMGIKMVTYYPGNAGTALPTHMAVIALFDPRTGEPLALMDGRYITEMRTAAVSAVATDVLAAGDAKVLTLIGAGKLDHISKFCLTSAPLQRSGYGTGIGNAPSVSPAKMESKRCHSKPLFGTPM